MIRGRRPRPHVTLVGAGLRGYAQLTDEARRAIAEARLVFFSRYGGDPTALVRALNPRAEVRDLEREEYDVGAFRPDMYRRMADTIVRAAARARGVVVLQPGSAVVVDTVTQLVLGAAARRGLDVRVVAGISCIEAVLGALGEDVADGLQVILAQRLVRDHIVLDARLRALIIQPGYFDTRFWAGLARSRPARFERLGQQLAQSHPPDAEMALVLVPPRGDDPPETLWFELRQLPQLHRAISPFHTLYIPARGRRRADARFARAIDSWPATLRCVDVDASGAPVEEDVAAWFSPGFALAPLSLRRASARIVARRRRAVR